MYIPKKSETHGKENESKDKRYLTYFFLESLSQEKNLNICSRYTFWEERNRMGH
jgi:hypothetical protein